MLLLVNYLACFGLKSQFFKILVYYFSHVALERLLWAKWHRRDLEVEGLCSQGF